jgi:glycosyltransferase involved in cell wall biosynthesis
MVDMTSTPWHIITSEYPPQLGGVSDYTQLVARELAAAGDEVHVWCPPATDLAGYNVAGRLGDSPGVIVHRDCGVFSPADLRRVGELLDQFAGPKRLLVQWVPHGYGYRSMNLRFCLWLKSRARQHDEVVELMVHEPYLPFGDGSWKQNGVAAVHRLMTVILMQAATRVWISIPAWADRLRPYALGRALNFSWLPIASSIAVVDDPDRVQSVLRSLPIGGDQIGSQILGHFGTYERNTTDLLLQTLPTILSSSPSCKLLLLGRGSEQMRAKLVTTRPELADRMHATGAMPASDVSLHLSACELLLQPYIDGVSSRRTSVMAGLSHGLPIVTTSGRLTEPLWAESEAVALIPVADIGALAKETSSLLADETRRRRLSVAAHKLYDEYFAIGRTVATLRAGVS